MTREERELSIKVIRNFDLNNPKVNSLLFSTDEITNAFDRAIEVLEQEPIIDKIRDEVTNISIIDTDGHSNNWYREPQAIINDVLQIIDKYR